MPRDFCRLLGLGCPKQAFAKIAALSRQLEVRVAAQAVGVVAVGVATGAVVDALTQQVDEAVLDVGGMAAILDGAREARNQPGLLIHAAQPQRANVAGTLETKPPSTSAPTVKLAMAGKRNCLGIESLMGGRV